MDTVNIIIAASNIFTGLLVIGLSIPLLLGNVKMNKWYGMRFPKAYESEENWYRINKYGAKHVMIWSIPVIATGIISLFIDFGPSGSENVVLLLSFGMAPGLLVIPCVQTMIKVDRICSTDN